MGFYDRDYYRAPTGGGGFRFGQFRMLSVTIWLIIINVVVFLLDPIFGLVVDSSAFRTSRPLAVWGHFSWDRAVVHVQVWRFITFQFLHADLMHLFFNMLAIYFFGPMLESHFGPRRYLGYYLLCGIGGAALYGVLMLLHVLSFSAYTPLVGASAGIFGILLGAARIAPDVQVMLMFPPIPMRLRTMAWLFLGFAVVTILYGGRNSGGEAAHLGGALAGLGLMQAPHLLNVFDFKLPTRRGRPRMRYRPRDDL